MFAEAAALAVACVGRDGWDDPAPPARIHGDTYYVGTCGISAILIASRKGHVLIDGGTAKGGDLIAANIERLGYRLRDVKWIVTSHEHFDHVGGVAGLQRQTGARVAAPAAAAPWLQQGASSPADPQTGALQPFAPIRVDRKLRDGNTITVGRTRLTIRATPGHAPGGASWTWQSCAGRNCRTIAYADSVSAISADGYRYADHPERVAAFRAAMATVAALPCDILLTPHPQASAMFERFAGRAPLADPAGCGVYAARGLAGLDARLAREAR